MAREYSEKAFLLEIDDYSLVEEYFKNRKTSGFSYTKDNKKKKKQVAEEMAAKIEAVLREQPEQTQQEIERDFAYINNLANEKGSQSLIAEANDQKADVPLNTLAELNNYDRAFWFFNNHPSIFEGAYAIQQFYDLSGWKRVPVPSKKIDFVAGKKETLIGGLKKYYEQEARGKYCYVDCYSKKDRIYVVAGVSDYAESDIRADEKTGKIDKRGTRRPFFEIYYLYRPSDEGSGELEIKAKGGWQKQRDLLGIFAKSVFEIGLDDSKQTFNLELLKDENFTIVSDPEDQMEWWWLKMVELLTPDRRSRIKLAVSDESRTGTTAIWNLLRQLNLASKMPQMIINSADIQIKFKPSRERKYQKGTVTFNINWKDKCTLNSIDETHLKARALLKKSKLDYGFTQKTSE